MRMSVMPTALRIATALCALWPVVVATQETAARPASLPGWQARDYAPRIIVSARPTVGASPRTIDVPVDQSINELLVHVESLPGIAVALLRPGGARAGATDGDVRLSDLTIMDLEREIPANLRLYTIARPQPGVWQVVLQDGAEPARQPSG
jgi:hypothetical protein